MIKKMIIASALIASSSISVASVLGDGQQVFSADVSYTSADKLWMGNESDLDFGGAKTAYYNYAVEYKRGIKWGLQLDGRLGYTVSRINDGAFSDATESNGNDSISEISLKVTKNLHKNSVHDLDIYFKYRHPGSDSDPTAPAFLAVNDFSSHMVLGLADTFTITNSFLLNVDLSYIKRSHADSLDAFELPADQIDFKLNAPIYINEKLMIFPGVAFRHTMSGPGLSTSGFNSISAQAGVPAFFAARERFFGYLLGASYYMPNLNSGLGFSVFKKASGQNTDQSTTMSVSWGVYL